MTANLDIDKTLLDEAEALPYPLLFATISGAHLYGFPSPNSDFDLRGAHILPVKDVIQLTQPRETIEISHLKGGLEIDLVTHDIKKFFSLMLKKNGYVLEQLYSPLVVRTSQEHAELKAEIGPQCITRYHVYHYNGFAKTQWALFEKTKPKQVKPLLYVFRVLLTGIHLMRAGVIEANLVSLNKEFRLSYIDELVELKMSGEEHGVLELPDLTFYKQEFDRLMALLEDAHQASRLPERPTAHEALNDLLVRIRLQRP
ncbi:MAG: nucleotidyltransferase domain-containing protein [Candidatus Obscuribacterales bacterium]|nr:nucleotidyltransferase domain-containing protein [Candidatus Obscuribacterales bacterium]